MPKQLQRARKTINKADRGIAKLFTKRMRAVGKIAEYKADAGLPVLDSARESEVIKRNTLLVSEDLRPAFTDYLKSSMQVSRAYQEKMIADKRDGALYVKHSEGGYLITIGEGLLGRADEFMNLNRTALIVTDSGVPKEYAEAVLKKCPMGEILTVKEGEGAKSFECLSLILDKMLSMDMDRTDCIIAVGGGVVGDLTALAASLYMRGVDFYNIPTTLLSQVDSSVGGKCALNYSGIKNIIGAFYPPKAVLIDTLTLKTLPKRHISSGLCEALKMALTCDAGLFEYFEENDISYESYAHIITEALKIKRCVVEADEKEGGVRKILNFGHTLGHAIEACEGLSGLYHGECVAIGMMPVLAPELRARVEAVLKKLSLSTTWYGDIKKALTYTAHDKKRNVDKLDVILVNKIGSYEIKSMSYEEFTELVLSSGVAKGE